MPPDAVNDYAGLALAFARALTDGHAPAAYAMTSADYQRRMSLGFQRCPGGTRRP